MSDNNMGERTVYVDPSMLEQLENRSKKKNTLVIVDNSGINELDLSAYSEAVYTFGRAEDNSIVISSDIVSGHHGEICINNGMFYIKDTNSSNGTYIAYGPHFSRITSGQYYGGDGRDMIIRLGTTKSMDGRDAVLMLYDSHATSGNW